MIPWCDLQARQFVGFATDQEVKRQLDALLSVLQRDGVKLEGQGPAVTLLQYNPPWTLPTVRRNELLILLHRPPVDSGQEPEIRPLVDSGQEPDNGEDGKEPGATA